MTAPKSFTPIPGVAICDHPTFACVTDSDAWGHGVFSWHTNREDAEFNAEVTGGTAVPVTLDAEGLAEVPELAASVIERQLGISHI